MIRSSDAYRESYFERVRSVYESVGGKEPEQYIEELQASMAAGKDYSSELVLMGPRGTCTAAACHTLSGI